jgi:hypothetical protein
LNISVHNWLGGRLSLQFNRAPDRDRASQYEGKLRLRVGFCVAFEVVDSLSACSRSPRESHDAACVEILRLRLLNDCELASLQRFLNQALKFPSMLRAPALLSSSVDTCI